MTGGNVTKLKSKASSEKVSDKPNKKGRLRENIEAILVAVILALFIRTFVVQAFKIPSGSMKETLQIGDHILVNKFIYGVKLPFAQTTIIPISIESLETSSAISRASWRFLEIL